MVTIIDYAAGNIRSVMRALSHLGIDWELSRDPERVRRAERVLFPGVGHARSAMEDLSSSGMAQALQDFARSGKPFLGICLGSQIVLSESAEGPTTCLGILEGRVRHFADLHGAPGNGDTPGSGPHERLKVPHMGWNKAVPVLEEPAARALFEGVHPEASFYFVHSYYTDIAGATRALSLTGYGCSFVSGLGRDNVAAFQFHPEKSGEPGLRMLSNFARWRP